jgi:hypothetical protein
MATDTAAVDEWLGKLKRAWEAGDVDGALALFDGTDYYYERPFHAGTTSEERRRYWQDIVGLHDIRFNYQIISVSDNTATVMWDNWFRETSGGEESHLNGVFVIEFDDDGRCRVFRQWWFAE